ncbi:MAG: Uma2 family endonuclease [Dehalococcoidia bacterium]
MATTTDAPIVLESGDRLSRAEFHRRYDLRPDIRKAELVLGVVYVPSPLRSEQHGEPHSLADFWLGAFAARTPGVRVSLDPTIYLTEDSEVQPDLVLFREPAPGGRLQRTPDGYLQGAPELVMEIAASSASYDLHDKREAYRRAAVPEYVVWRVIDQAIDWFRLHGGAYVPVAPDERGVIESAVFPGLRLSVPAMLAGDRAAILAALDPPLPR